ncbi:MAG TPA: hypothetical protein VK674_00095 [Candidatus Limnocylindria bacterium]|nr:hypothetical protein [Candidatus Limnocylindria bacterium]
MQTPLASLDSTTSELWTPNQPYRGPELIGLPDWLDLSPETLADCWLAALSVTHGNELFWDEIIRKRQQDPKVDGFLPIRANPKAADNGERFKDHNLVFCYDPDVSPGAHETLVAEALKRLFASMDPERIVIDGHNTRYGSQHFEVGQTAPPEVYAAARVLGFENGIIVNTPFYKYVSRSLVAEVKIDSLGLGTGSDQEKLQHFDAALDIILQMGKQGLQELFRDEGTEGMTFHRFELEICLTNRDGTPNLKVLKALPELEALPVEPEPFTKVPLPNHLAERLGLDPNLQYYRTYWGENESEYVPPDLPGLPDDGRRRQKALGGLVVKINPPVLASDGLVHAEV